MNITRIVAVALATLSLASSVAQALPPTTTSPSERPYCPYGKKSDGTCWVRCKYIICL